MRKCFKLTPYKTPHIMKGEANVKMVKTVDPDQKPR